VARQEGVDPVGSCVGLRGFRIQNIVNELQGEKIDVLPFSDDMEDFLANALSPAQVVKVDLEQEEKSAMVVVPDRYLSLAIGREGQNARLAAKLTGWRIDIRSESEFQVIEEEAAAAGAEAAGGEGGVAAAAAA
ncbi:MAG: transcription termination/antitermination protein NusA, partial [Chloroflexota bacterium]|nr:transcription termination/antitermination protein NusA [Chloroflexota bacterium]